MLARKVWWRWWRAKRAGVELGRPEGNAGAQAPNGAETSGLGVSRVTSGMRTHAGISVAGLAHSTQSMSRPANGNDDPTAHGSEEETSEDEDADFQIQQKQQQAQTLPSRPSTGLRYRPGVAFRQKVSMFARHLAHNRRTAAQFAKLDIMQQDLEGRDPDGGESGGDRDVVSQLRVLCQRMEFIQTAADAFPAAAGTSQPQLKPEISVQQKTMLQRPSEGAM
jgi:hypothetical protein